jgi:DNA-binding NtrC family response regulator/tetratricopeptide (TPR) repeat protein
MANRRQPSATHPSDRILGTSQAIVALRAQICRLAPFDTVGGGFIPTVLLEGETGTGKGLVARVLHDSGPRARGPFLEVNCAAIPETLLESELFGFEAGAFTDARRPKPGLFEAAVGGTLFLDEVDAIPPSLQGKLLKAIEDRRVRRLGATADTPVDVKLTAATQTELRARVAQGRFRTDLYYRLAVLVLEVPPLRTRREDVVLLAQHWLRRYAEGHGLAPKRLTQTAEAWLGAYGWPGNVRELSHLMERVTLLRSEPLIDADILEQLCLPPIAPRLEAAARPEPEATVLDDEPAQIARILRETAGNVAETARRLGWTRKTLRYRIRRYGIDRPGHRGRARHPTSATRPTLGVAEPRPPAEPRGRSVDSASAPAPDGEELATAGWEQKSVAILAIDVTWPETAGHDAPRHEPWTVRTGWEHVLAATVQGFGGAVLQRAPSLWVVSFGLPPTVEQLPERAAHAALAIRRVVAEARGVRRQPCPEIRQAVHWGDLLVDAHAREPGTKLLPIGDTLALPVRLLGQAPSGEIVISAQAARLLGTECVLEPSEGSAGGDRPDQPVAYRIVGPTSRQLLPSADGAPPLGPFVGRERELAVLTDLLEQAESGRGQVVALVGEAGMGKSRLLAEFCHRLPASRVVVLEGRGLSYERGIPYRPVVDVLRALAGIQAQDDHPAIREKLLQTLLALNPALQPLFPALLHLFEAPVDDPDWRALEPAVQRQRTLEAVAHLLLEVSRRRLVVLIVENLHWVDTGSHACLDRLIEGLPAARLLLVVTYRPECQHAWGGKTYYSQLRLDPLSTPQAEALFQALLGRDPSLRPLQSHLIERTEGNPFFLQQSAWALVDRNILIGAPGAYRLAKALPALPVPATVHAVLAARIGGLPAEAKRLLQAASVIGRDVPLALLQAIADRSDDALRRSLTHLQATEFLYETSRFATRTYTFKHALTREVAYEGLLPQRRRALHAHIVEVLEAARDHERMADQVDRLAHHAARGHLWEKAVTYLRQAAAKAAARAAITEAATYYEEALRALHELPESRATHEEAVDLGLALCGALVQLGDYERMGNVLREAERRAVALDDPPRLGQVASYLAHYRWQVGDLENALVSGQRALAAAQALKDLRLEIEARIRLGVIYDDLGEHQQAIACLGWNVSALTGALERERFGVVVLPAVVSRIRLARSLTETGAFAAALVQAEEALRIARASEHPYSLIAAEDGVGMVHLRQGTLHHAIPVLERGLEGCRVWNTPGYLTYIASNLGYAYALSGRVAEAIPLLEEAVEQAAASRRTVKLPLWMAQLGEGYLLAGRTTEAARQAQRALELARCQRERGHEGYALRLLGEVDTHRDPPAFEPAVASYREALTRAHALEMRVLRAHCELGLGRLYARVGRREEAQTALSLAIAEYRAMAMIHYVKQAELILAQAG